MRVKYFRDTDTLYIAFKSEPTMETHDLDGNIFREQDAHGHVCALTIEHARERTDIPQFS